MSQEHLEVLYNVRQRNIEAWEEKQRRKEMNLDSNSQPENKVKLTGSLSNYYLVDVPFPQREDQEPYTAECEDIIEALGLNFDEGNIFKAIWRRAKLRQGKGKVGNTSLYDAEKILHYAKRIHRREELNGRE